MDPNDEIVISGIAGRYPECENFDEFKQALLEGIDLVTEDARRFPLGKYIQIKTGSEKPLIFYL